MNPTTAATIRKPKRKTRRFRKAAFFMMILIGLAAIFLYLTPMGTDFRVFLAETVITTQHREWAWLFVGKAKQDEMIRAMENDSDLKAKDPLNTKLIHVTNRPIGDLVKVEDISGTLFKGKMMTVYDPKSIRVVVPSKQGEGERITDMVRRTGALAGLNAGGFDDPDGLGNGFAPIGMVMSDARVLYTDVDGSEAQHIVGFSDNGTLIVGKYTLDELRKMKVKEAVSFYPRVIVNGKPLITSGDGGWGRAPRTAVGQKADGTVIFIVIDGRQASSVGATLKEVQDIFLAHGVMNAGFLDGGASSELVVNNELITHPSSRYGERRLPSAFLVFDHPESVAVTSPWQGLTKIDPGGASTHPEYQAELKRKQEARKAASHPVQAAKKATAPTHKDETGHTGSQTHDPKQ
ncbi:phosphodiester glycosidase family protein [Paenibacillus filicis]|uniref:Phosphodiester glycosidase family protein n=1 Tax=Paenibacillus gyeongsangnamensis TaxID=3388067 RepID=A0ABT4Q3J9_9BACL|nr:phosphodiester glycosidase family protein [Paenibacillus filicis]MCZ8511393.1 phosphodiester glycosidase family protein [Paenibacillus filicis]